MQKLKPRSTSLKPKTTAIEHVDWVIRYFNETCKNLRKKGYNLLS